MLGLFLEAQGYPLPQHSKSKSQACLFLPKLSKPVLFLGGVNDDGRLRVGLKPQNTVLGCTVSVSQRCRRVSRPRRLQTRRDKESF